MRKHSVKKFVATLLAAGILVTSVFPETAYAVEVGEQVAETVLEQAETEETVPPISIKNETEESEEVVEDVTPEEEKQSQEGLAESEQRSEPVKEQKEERKAEDESDEEMSDEKLVEPKKKEKESVKKKEIEKKESKVSANPNGENLVWKSGYASESNLFGQNLNNEKEFVVDSTTNKIVIYSSGYTENGNFHAYTSSSTPEDRKSKFQALKYYLESSKKYNIYLQTNITCTAPITVVGTKGLHGYGYLLRQNLESQYNKFTYRDGVYLDSSIINVPVGTTLKMAHVEMKGQAADNKICGAYHENGQEVTSQKYAAVHDGISSKGKLYVTNVKIHHCKRGVLVSDGTATISGGCYYYNKGSGIIVLNKTESGEVQLRGVNCYSNSSRSDKNNNYAFGEGKYCNFVAPEEASYSGINLHVSTTICAWTPEGLGVTYYPIARKNERFGIAATQGGQGTYALNDVRASENGKDGVCVKNKTITLKQCVLNDNKENGLQIGANTTVMISGNESSISGNQNNGIWNEKGMLTMNGGNVCNNTEEGVLNTGTLTINNGSFYGSKKASGVNSTGTLTVNGGSYYGNKTHGIAVDGGTANIYYGTFGTYSNDSGKTWVNVGNISAGIRTKKATTNVYGGVFFYNENGMECQDGTLNLNYDGTHKRTIYVSDNTKNGLYSKGEVKKTGGSVDTAGGNIVIASNAQVDAHGNKSAAIYAENKAKVSTGAGFYYNSQYGINVASGGTVTLSGGEVYGNKTYGVYNNGTFTMSGGKVRDNDDNGTAAGGTKKDGIYNEYGTVNVSGGEIRGNENGINNTFSGTTTVDGESVSITGNTRGIQNTADANGVTVKNASVKGNTTADISQSGKMFTISGANTKADTIELGVKDGKCEVVTVDGALKETKKVVFIQNYKNNDYSVANKTIGRPMFKCTNTTPKAILDSGKLVFADGKQITLVKDKEEKAIMRPFKGSNMNESLAGGNVTEKDKYIVLSTKYAATYKVRDSLDGIKFILPDSEDIFWKEENEITLKPLKAIINGVEQVFDIAGWLKDGIGNAIEVGKKILFGVDESEQDHELVAQLGMCNLIIDGNGQSQGDNYIIEGFNCAKDKLPENTFEKEFKDNWYYTELEEQKQHETKYSYQGWSLSDDAAYQSEGVYQPDGSLDYQKIMKYVSEHKEEMTYGENGFPNITLYAVWDKYPELQAKEIGFAEMELDQSLNEGVEQSYYLDDKAFAAVLYERVVGTDDEDGALTNGTEEKGVICEDSLEDLRAELLSFEHTGATTVTFKATDGVGNVTERRVRVWINKGKEIEEAYINRARVINRKYYNVGKEYADKLIEDNKKRSESEQIGVYEISVACMALRGELDRSDKGDAYIEAHKAENPALGYLTGYNRGGLMPIDKWYTDPEYRKCIEEAFDNQENETPEYSWKFTHEQVLETQEYVETYGISTSEHQDALWNYFNKYKASFKKLK